MRMYCSDQFIHIRKCLLYTVKLAHDESIFAAHHCQVQHFWGCAMHAVGEVKHYWEELCPGLMMLHCKICYTDGP
jgi:hypothetical protein